jgi:hypothetical protein
MRTTSTMKTSVPIPMYTMGYLSVGGPGAYGCSE